MGTLKHHASGSEHVLTARHVVGRAPACQLRVNKPEVSGLHAELVWDGDRWSVQDLGSRNGTFVDGKRIAAGERAPLRKGASIAFGQQTDPYDVTDVEPPRLMAVAADGRTTVADGNLLALPNEETAEVTVYEDAAGQWVLESSDGARTFSEHEVVVVDGSSWTIYVPTASALTHDAASRALPLDAISMEFEVSRDEEFVKVRITHDDRVVELEPRAHAQLLLNLARIRLADRERGDLAESEHGWVHRDDLLKVLGVDMQLLNLWVFRARQQLVKTGIRDAGSIIERRSGTLQLRIGVVDLRLSS